MKALIVLLIVILPSFAGELIVYEENQDRDKAINIIVVAEGYTGSEQSLFQQDIIAFANATFSDPVLAAYRSYHNIYGLFVASNESGADDPNGGVTRDTYFDATYNTYNIDRLLTVNSGLVKTEVNKVLPEADIIMVSVNYDKYGGSGGAIATSSSSSPEIVAHEIGHSFVGLKDEYDYTANYTPYEGINATAKTAYDEIRWNYWIEKSTPLPTPESSQYADVIGLFEGANYQATGWYRPQLNCRMKSNGVDLCAVCAEAWVLQVYDLVSPLISVSHPTGSNVTFDGNDSIVITHHNPTNQSVLVEWYQDGEKLDHSGNSLSSLSVNGTVAITAVVKDTTSWVREDPSALLSDTLSWSVTDKGSSITGISNDKENPPILVQDRIIMVSERSEETVLRLYNMRGQELWRTTGIEQKYRVPPSVGTGIFMMRVTGLMGELNRVIVLE